MYSLRRNIWLSILIYLIMHALDVYISLLYFVNVDIKLSLYIGRTQFLMCYIYEQIFMNF